MDENVYALYVSATWLIRFSKQNYHTFISQKMYFTISLSLFMFGLLNTQK